MDANAINYSKTDYTYDELNVFHTRQLLKYLDIHRRTDWDCVSVSEAEAVKSALGKVRDILKSRPHVMGKKESKQARIERKKSGTPR